MFEAASCIRNSWGFPEVYIKSRPFQRRQCYADPSRHPLPIHSQHIRNMAPVTGVVQSGTYIIQNVASKNYAILKDGNKGSPVTSSNNAQDENAKVSYVEIRLV
jgi:hypothetical protein